MGRCGFFTFLGKAPLAFPPVMLNMPWQSGPHWVMGFRREVAQEQNTGSAARDCVCSIVDFPCNRYCEYSAPGWLSLPGKVGGKCAARRSVARSHFERGNLDLDQITIRTRGRGGLDRFSGRLSGLRSRREAGAPLCDWPDRDTHFLIWTGRDFPARCLIDILCSALFPLHAGRFLGDRQGALVVFSFQIGRRAQDVEYPSVIIPNLR